MTVTGQMKAKANAVLIVAALLAYWLGLCNASAFYKLGGADTTSIAKVEAIVNIYK